MAMKDFKRSAARFLEKLKIKYPHQDTAEYTRLVAALEAFLAHGCWDGED